MSEATEAERGQKALALWLRWWNESQGNPFESCECDTTGLTYCFFCSEPDEHRPNCIYLSVQELLDQDLDEETITRIKAEGIAAGMADRDRHGPEPYPPYTIGTHKANWWQMGYEQGRYNVSEAQA